MRENQCSSKASERLSQSRAAARCGKAKGGKYAPVGFGGGGVQILGETYPQSGLFTALR